MPFVDSTRPRLALTVGDPAGIGPEIVRAALDDPRSTADCDLVAIGPASARPDGVPTWDGRDGLQLNTLRGAMWLETPCDDDALEVGKVSATGGAAALAALRAATDRCLAGALDGMVNAPVSKEALHLAGEKVEGQTELLGRWSKAPRMQMLAISGPLRVLLLSRHMPLRDALDLITTERVLEHLSILHDGLCELGFERPHLGLAGLNPHAGENGLLGTEDRDVLVPAAEAARAKGLDVTGPLSPDSIFVRGSKGEFDGILALYHDQAFIPTKLLRPDGGMTVLVGMPFVRVSPAHGTAMDVAGKGIARPDNLIESIVQAAEWASLRRARRMRQRTV
ncbi:4-hydroxythreonine-4-phosphate dehydrogenase [Planctomycetes bacterium Pla163]|uniref:4-hydroxythreonine-4-phosphate dehydrogenase n=1 Tax=Rohdeia mirabilis TaxID=2528008 RepID=A0A518CWZ0_9BACT|nr:4-hydroxythreonine-4-phosphate dehydrogenase [Planctomycetes bacterium Pla163]